MFMVTFFINVFNNVFNVKSLFRRQDPLRQICRATVRKGQYVTYNKYTLRVTVCGT